MEFGFRRCDKPVRWDCRQRFIEDRNSAVDIARARLGLSERDLDDPVIAREVRSRAAVRSRRICSSPSAGVAALGRRHCPRETPPTPAPSERSCSRASWTSSTPFDAARERSPRINSNMRPYALPVCARAGMGEGRIPRIRVKFERNGAFDVAQGPQGHREERHRPDARIEKPNSQTVVVPGLKQSQSLFKMLPRLAVLSGEPMRDSGRAVSDSGLGRIGSRPTSPGRFGAASIAAQLAALVAAGPQTVVGRQPFRRVFVAPGTPRPSSRLHAL